MYLDRFDLLRAAVERHRLGIEIILSGSPGQRGRTYNQIWEHARTSGAELIVDEYFYASPRWFSRSAERYDDYDRNGPRVFAGEYAAQFPNITTRRDRRKPANTYASALAEAAFYTGVIRNSDIVAMTSYAPLLNMVEEGQWSHNFIDFNPLTVQPTVHYEMQKFFTDSLGDRTITLPPLPAGLLGSATRTDEFLFLHFVNQTEAPIDLGLSIAAATGSFEAYEFRAAGAYRHSLGFSDAARSAVTPVRVYARDQGGVTTVTVAPRSVFAVTCGLM